MKIYRYVWMMAFILLFACTSQTQRPITDELRVMTPDWGIAQVLIAIDAPLVAMGDVQTYPDWSSSPAIPDDVADLGLRFSPNPQMFANVDANLVLDSAFYAHIRPMYKHIRHIEISAQIDDVATWQNYADEVMQIGRAVAKEQQAAQYLSDSRRQLQKLGDAFENKYAINKISVVQFANAQHLRLYTANSLLQMTANEMGLSLYAPKQGNQWGSIDISLHELAELPHDVCLIVIEPFSPMLQAQLSTNKLWQRMGFGMANGRCMAVLEPIWVFGSVPSALNFAHALERSTIINAPIAHTSANKEGIHE